MPRSWLELGRGKGFLAKFSARCALENLEKALYIEFIIEYIG